jgi:hypothetical protein
MSKEAYYLAAETSKKKNGLHPLCAERIRVAPSTLCTVFFFEKSETRDRAGEKPRIVYNGKTGDLRRWLRDQTRAGAWMVNRMAHALALLKHFEEGWHGQHEGGYQDKRPNHLCRGCREIAMLSSREHPLLVLVREYLARSVTFTWQDGDTPEKEYSGCLVEQPSENWLGSWALKRFPKKHAKDRAEQLGLPPKSNGKPHWWDPDEDLRTSGIWRIQ